MSYKDDVDATLAMLGKALSLLASLLKARTPAPVVVPAPAPFMPNLDEAQHHDPPAPVPSTFEELKWDTPPQAWHSTRVLCDRMQTGLVLKNTICACIYQESNFYNRNLNGSPVKNENKNGLGVVTSRDWGIVQINDYYHIGPGKDFPSVEYVVAHPEKMVAWMIQRALAGQLRLWSSYSTGAYKRWLPLSSPMWKLAQKVPEKVQ